MSSLAVSLSPYSNTHMHQVLTSKVATFLGMRDSLVNYSAVDKRHRDNFAAHGMPVTSLTISVDLANALFAHIQTFPQLEKIVLKAGENGDNFQPLVIGKGSGKVSHLLFSGIMGPGGFSPRIQQFLKAIPNLRGIGMYETGGWNRPQFRPIEGERISDKVLENMELLTDLDLTHSNINPHAILQILQRSTSFKSVTLSSQQITTAILRELVRSPDLAHLDLSNTRTRGEVDYAVLAECHTLESFTPSAVITEEALIAIITANPNLTRLDLHRCKKEVLTDRVLQAIAANLPGLQTLDLSGETEFTDAGFIPLLQGCKELQSFSLGNPKNVSAGALVELKQCAKLTELKFSCATLSDAVLHSLATMSGLTALSLCFCSGFSAESLLGLQALVKLEKLNLDGIQVLSDEIIGAFVDHCPRLDTLRINAWRSSLTEASFRSIETAIREKRTALKDLSWAEPGPEIQYQMKEALKTRLKADGFFQLNSPPPTRWE